MNHNVNYWGSHPDVGYDVDHIGYNFDSASEAIAFKAPIQNSVYVQYVVAESFNGGVEAYNDVMGY